MTDQTWSTLLNRRDEVLAPAREWGLILQMGETPYDQTETLFGFEDAIAGLIVMGEEGEASKALESIRELWPAATDIVSAQLSSMGDVASALLCLEHFAAALGSPFQPSLPNTWVPSLAKADPPLPSVRRSLLEGENPSPLEVSTWPAKLHSGQEDFADLVLRALAQEGEPALLLSNLRQAAQEAAN